MSNMTGLFDPAADGRPVSALIDAVLSAGRREDAVTRLRRLAEQMRSATKGYAEKLDRLYDDVLRSGHDADWIDQAAEIARQKKLSEQEKLAPLVESLKRKFHDDRYADPEMRHLVEEKVAIADAWLALPAALHERLLRLAATRRAAAQQIRHAHPVKGEIDHEALSREHMARYPKIRAALAK